MSATAEKIVFSFGTTLVSSSLIAGEYPAVSSSIIPQNFNYFLDVNAQQLLNALTGFPFWSPITPRSSSFRWPMIRSKFLPLQRSDRFGRRKTDHDSIHRRAVGDRFQCRCS
jgi:hypothetical protein